MNAIDVKPKKWSEIRVLYDDNEYSIIFGKFADKYCLGTRWNEGGSNSVIGYPNHGGNPVWYVEPHFISRAIIDKLVSIYSSKDVNRKYVNIDEVERSQDILFNNC